MKKTIQHLDFMAPIKTISEANRSNREHWAVKMQRRKAQQQEIDVVMSNALRGRVVALPCTVRLTRIGPKALDSDNLSSAFKVIRDAIARRLEIDDGDPRITFQYAQMPVGIQQYGVKVSIQSTNGE